MKEIPQLGTNSEKLYSPFESQGGHAESRINSSEYEANKEIDIPNTVEAFLVDNKSDEAEQNRVEFAEKRARGEIAYLARCGDARQVTPNPTSSYVDNRIAAAIDPSIAEKAFNSPAVRFGMIIPHYDGASVVPGVKPSGCGGQGAKAEIITNGTTNSEDPLEQFINNRVRHPDFIVNTLALGRELAGLSTNQPVVVAPQDHRTGELKPLAVFQKSRGIMNTIMPEDLYLPLDGQYKPEEIYANGVPFMDRGNLPEDVQEYLYNYDKQLLKLKENNPNFYQDQAVQNPRYIFFSTDLKDFKVWLPHTGNRPNVGFRLTVPRKRIGDGEDIHLSETDKRVAFQQSEYVMRESVAHAEQPEKPFHDTKTMVIMTGNYQTSLEFARELTYRVQHSAHLRDAQSWLALPDREIIVGQTNAGHITKIGTIDYKINNGEIVQFEDKAYNIQGKRI